MNLFDNEFDDIIDSETTSSSVSTEMRVNEFKKWKHEVLSLKKRKDDIYNRRNIVHNIDDIILEGNSVTLIFDSNVEKNVILCPINYIISCPLSISNINIENNTENDIRLILYSPRKYNDSKLEEDIVNKDDLEMLSLINFNNMNITDILFRGTFSTFDDYHKYIDIVKNKFNYATIWMNYETRIEHPDTTIKPLKRNNCHISALLRYDELIDTIIYNDTVNISYCNFINSGILQN